jgi:spermidine/putrescine transport system substrate-binding protein
MESKQDVAKFIDDFKMGRLTRRQFSLGLASVGLATVMMRPNMRRALAGDADPTVYTWGGYEPPEMYKPYTAKYDSSPNFSLWGDEEEAEAKMRAGFHPDVAMPCSYKVKKWSDLGFIKPVDTDRLSNWGDVIDVLKTVPDMMVGDDRMMIPAWWGLTSVTFRTDLAPEYIPEETHSWGILWDPKYSGRLSMIDSLIDGVMVAAIYSGAKDPFNMTPEEVEKVRELMREQRGLLRFYTNDVTSWEQGLASGELVAAASWNDTPTRLGKQGLEVAFMKPKEGAMTWTCGLVLTSWVTPEMEDRAYDVIDAYLSSETGSYWIEEFGMGHSNIKSFEAMAPEELTKRGLPPSDIPGYIASGIFQATIQNEPELQAMYEEVKAGL